MKCSWPVLSLVCFASLSTHAEPEADLAAPNSAVVAPPTAPMNAASMGQLLDGTEHDRQRIEERLAQLEKRSLRLSTQLRARGRAYVRLVRAGLLPVGGGLDSLMDHAAELERLRRAVARDVASLKEVQAEQAAVKAKLDNVAEKVTRFTQEKDALARSHQLILAAEEREQAFRRAFESNWSPTQHTTVYGGGFGADPASAQSFASLKGRLPFPIAGRAEIEATTLPAKDPGLTMTTRSGAPVRAIYPGRVAFADTYAEYGKTVIVDHGSKYYTVSAKLSQVDVQVGDEVALGDRLGTVSGAAGRGTLYFELRHAGQTLRPEAWFGL